MHAESPDLAPFLTHRSFVRSLAASLLRDPSDVDEVEQETWISALQGPGSAVRDVRSWLSTVVRHHALNLTRRGRRQQARDQAAARPDAAAEANGVLERLETGQVLVTLVMRVAEPNRKALLLRYYEDLSLTQIAQRLGVSPTVVKGRVQRGLQELRGLVADYDSRSGEAWRRDLAALAAAPLPAQGLLVAAAPWALGALLIVGAVALPSQVRRWSTPAASPAAQRNVLDPELQVAALPSVLPAEARGAAAERSAVAATTSAAGEIELGIGDAFVFGDALPRPDGDRTVLDLYVQDIRHGVSLATLAGSTTPAHPLTSAGLPTSPQAVMALLEDAPVELPMRDLWLLETCSAKRPGIGIAMSRSGQAYKLCLIELDGHPEALRRRVRIAYEPIPSVEAAASCACPRPPASPRRAPWQRSARDSASAA